MEYYESLINKAKNVLLVGREEELELFDKKLSLVKDGNGQFIVLSGPVGIGKSRLVGEFAKKISNTDIVGFGIECDAIDINKPYSLWINLLKKFIGTGGLKSALTKDSIENYLLSIDKNLIRKLPSVSGLLGIDKKIVRQTKDFNPSLIKEDLFSIMIETLKHKAKKSGGLFLVIEDVDYMDESSLELLSRLPRNIKEEQIMLVATYRNKINSDNSHKPTNCDSQTQKQDENILNNTFKNLSNDKNYENIHLTSLGEKHIISLIENKIGEKITSEDLKGYIMKYSIGNPLFAEEFIYYLTRNKAIIYDDNENKYQISSDLFKFEIPNSIEKFILTRTEDLDKECRECINLASAIGKHFDYETLNATFYDETSRFSENKEYSLLEILSNLERCHLVESLTEGHKSGYAFTDRIKQEVIHKYLTKDVKYFLHKKIAEYYENRHPQELYTITYHYENSENRYKAIEMIKKLAEHHKKNGAKKEEIRSHERLLENVKCLINSGKMVKIVKDAEIDSKILLDKAKKHYNEKNYDLALMEFEALLEINKKWDLKSKTAVDMFNIGVILYEKGRHEESISSIKKSLLMAKEINNDLLIKLTEDALKEFE